MRAARLADRAEERVDEALGAEAEAVAHLLGGRGQGGRHHEVVHRLRGEPRLLQRPRHDLRDDPEEALVADPALLPVIVELLGLAAVVIDEVDARRFRRDELGDRALAADREGGRRVAVARLVRRAGPGAAVVRGDDEDLVAVGAALRRLQGGEEGRGPGALRAADVEAGDLAEIERRRDDPRVLAVLEGQRGRAEIERADPGFGRRQSRAASTAMVSVSSSQLQMARSPLARAAAPGWFQRCASAIVRRASRRRGT